VPETTKKRHLQLSQIEKEKRECYIQLLCTEMAGTSLATLAAFLLNTEREYHTGQASCSYESTILKHHTAIFEEC